MAWRNNQRHSKKSSSAHIKNHVPKDFFMVYKGHRTGRFESWADCKSATSGYSGAKFKGFYVGEEKKAEHFLKTGEIMGPPTRWYSVDVRPFAGSGIYTSWNQAENVVRNVPAQHKGHDSFEEAEISLLNQGFAVSEIHRIESIRAYKHVIFVPRQSEPFDTGFQRLALVKDWSAKSIVYHKMFTRASRREIGNTYCRSSILAERLANFTQEEKKALEHNRKLLCFPVLCKKVDQQYCDIIGERIAVLQGIFINNVDSIDADRILRQAQNLGEPKYGPISRLPGDRQREIGNAFICPRPWKKIRSYRSCSNSWITPPHFANVRFFVS